MGYWPSNIPRNDLVQTFVVMFESLGYQLCETCDLEDGFEKVAIYSRGDAVLHAARQLHNGNWTSKMGSAHDIEHTLKGLEGPQYGQVACCLRRRRAH